MLVAVSEVVAPSVFVFNNADAPHYDVAFGLQIVVYELGIVERKVAVDE